MEQSPPISTLSPSRISAVSRTSQEPSGSCQPYFFASEAQCGNSSREYPAMLPGNPTASPSSIESAFSAEGDGGAPAAVAGPEKEPSFAGKSSQGMPSPSPSR